MESLQHARAWSVSYVLRAGVYYPPGRGSFLLKCPSRNDHYSNKFPNYFGPSHTIQPVASVPAETSSGTLAKTQSPSHAAITIDSVTPTAPSTFEPVLPETEVLAAQGLVLALTITAAIYWWLVVVPTERASLGRSKRMGPLDNYMQDLERPEASGERWWVLQGKTFNGRQPPPRRLLFILCASNIAVLRLYPPLS